MKSLYCKILLFLLTIGLLSSCNQNNYDYLYSQSPDALGDSVYITGSFYYRPFEEYGEVYSVYFVSENNYDAEFGIALSEVVLYSTNYSYDELDITSGASSTMLSDSTLSLYVEDGSGAGAFSVEMEGLSEGNNAVSSLSYADVILITPNGGNYRLSNAASKTGENFIELYAAGIEEIEGTFGLNVTTTRASTD